MEPTPPKIFAVTRPTPRGSIQFVVKVTKIPVNQTFVSRTKRDIYKSNVLLLEPWLGVAEGVSENNQTTELSFQERRG